MRLEKQKLAEAEEKANKTEDVVEREKLMREVEKSQKKINQTQKVLERGNLPDEISEVTPMAPNYEGGTTSSFHLAAQASPEPPKKKAKQSGPSTRPKKSKEKKQAEKDAAEAAYAAMEREELVRIAPKLDPRKEAIKKEAKTSQRLPADLRANMEGPRPKRHPQGLSDQSQLAKYKTREFAQNSSACGQASKEVARAYKQEHEGYTSPRQAYNA